VIGTVRLSMMSHMTMYRLNPSRTLREHTDGRAFGLVEVFILLACQAGASQLKFWTIGKELRIAEVIDGSLYEFRQPPDHLQSPMMDQLRRIFSMTAEQTQAECELQLAHSTSYARIEFKDDRGAVVTILRNFEPPIAVSNELHRFFRDYAASQGIFALARYYTIEALGFLYNAANKAIHPSRR